MLHLVKRLAGFILREGTGRTTETERRQAVRVKTPIHMDICFLEGPQEDFGDGRVQDISVSGLHFTSDVKPANGSPLVIKIHFPKAFAPKQPLQIRAKVVRRSRLKWRKLYSVACAFMNLDHTSRKRLEDFTHWIARV